MGTCQLSILLSFKVLANASSFTLCFPQRSWMNLTSPLQRIPALVSLWLFSAAAKVFLCIRALEGQPHTWGLSCALNGRTWLRSIPWHQDRNNCNFSGLGTLRKGNILKFSFCFLTGTASSLRRGCESSCESQGCMLCTGERTGQSPAQSQDQAPLGEALLGFHGKVVGGAVRYHCEKDRWVGGGRNF